ncbi:MAG: glycosyltransferase family 4 protein [Pseudomonadota bacterium]
MTDSTLRPTVWHIGGDDVHKRIPLLHALKDRGFNVAAVGSEDDTEFQAHDIPYFHYNLERKLTPLSDLRSCRELSTLFKKQKPDIVHGFDPKPAIATPILAQRAGVPARVRTITGLGFVMTSNSLKARMLRPLYRHLQRQASASSFTIFQNNDDRAYFLQNELVEQGREDLVLSSGVDVEKLRSERPGPEHIAAMRRSLGLDGKLVVTMISRIDENKGVREFVQAAGLVQREIKNTAFLLVGPYASEGKQAQQFVEQLKGQPETVQYLGPRKDIPAILALSDVCALPSYREGLPRVLVEAGALEVPCVTTDVPGCRDVVLDDWNGRLVPPKDSRALANALIELLGDQTRRTEMGQRSYRHVKEKFDLSTVADAYAGIYFRALAGGR